ncbi:MAG TPA: hypothetical protein DCW68_02480 [Rhodospirillaceae bacterium]|nr:hypothetical protein [Rhodospirillaceae bacterium]
MPVVAVFKHGPEKDCFPSVMRLAGLAPLAGRQRLGSADRCRSIYAAMTRKASVFSEKNRCGFCPFPAKPEKKSGRIPQLQASSGSPSLMFVSKNAASSADAFLRAITGAMSGALSHAFSAGKPCRNDGCNEGGRADTLTRSNNWKRHDKGCKAMTTQETIRKNLFEATRQGDLPQVKKLIAQLDEGTQLSDVKDMNDFTPLHLAAAMGHKDLAELLAETCPDAMMVRDINGLTPLHYAAGERNTDVVELLAKECPDAMMVRDINGNTPLHEAAAKGHNDIAEFLAEKCPDAMMVQNNKGNTPLHWAVYLGCFDIVEFLAEKGPGAMMMKDKYGLTPQDVAAENEDEDTAAFLEKKIRDALKVKNGDAPLTMEEFNRLSAAAEAGEIETVRKILKAKGVFAQKPKM